MCIRYGKRKRACLFDGLVICLLRVEHHNKGVKRLRATYLGWNDIKQTGPEDHHTTAGGVVASKSIYLTLGDSIELNPRPLL